MFITDEYWTIENFSLDWGREGERLRIQQAFFVCVICKYD